MRKSLTVPAAAALAVGVWACSDLREPNTIVDLDPLEARVRPCDLSSLEDAARRYMGSPYQQEATSKLGDIESEGCTGTTAEQLAWEVLDIVETVFYARAGGPAAEGSTLVTGLMNCCIPSGTGFTLDPKVLGTGGGFGVRGALAASTAGISNTEPVLTRDPVTLLFGSEDGFTVERPAVLGIRPRATTWENVAFGSGDPDTYTDEVLAVTAFPFGSSPHAFFSLNEAPDLGFQPGAQVDVIVCFTDGASAPADPHGPNGEDLFEARVKRNGIVLQTVVDQDDFCQQYVWGPLAVAESKSSSWSRLVRMAGDILMPEPLGALALSDRTSLSLGGGASFFSNFGAANANVNGTLVFTQSPPNVVRSTTAQFPVKVMAKTGGGSPIELAEITLSIMNNNGVPGELIGSFKLCNGSATTQPVGCTKELDGIADFLVSITKAGGYIMCATGTAEGFTFAQACTDRFNVRN